MTARRCASCYASINALPSYARLCKPCFVEGKKREVTDLQTEVIELRAEVEQLRAHRGLQMDSMMLRRLVQLCHPDRHGGSVMAHETTQFLLGLRRGATQ